MAEITGNQLIDDSAIEKSNLLSKALKNAANELDQIIKVSTGVSSSVKTNTDSFSKLEVQQKKLNTAQQQYVKIQDSIQKESKDTAKELNTQGKAANNAGKESEKGADGAKKYGNALKQLKADLKAAQNEMVAIAATLGQDSKQFQDAAVKAGKLKDELNDIQDALKNTSASPFENLSTSLGSVGSKLLSLDFGGAAASAKQFATASKAITFKEAIGGIKDFGNTILTVGKAILTNPLFLLGAVFTALVVAVVKFRNEIKPVKFVLDAIGDATDYVVQKLKDFTDWLGLTTFAENARTEAIISNSKKQIEATEEYYDISIKLAAAAGKKTEELEREKWRELKKIATEGLKAAFDPTKSLEDQSDEVKAFYKTIKDAEVELGIITAEEAARRAAAWKKMFDYARDQASKFKDEQIVNDVKIGDAAVKALEDIFLKRGEYIEAVEEQEEGLTDFELAELHKRIKAREDAEKRKKQLAIEAFNFGVDILSLSFVAEQRDQEQQAKADADAKEQELERAGDNKDAIAAINKKFSIEDKKLKQEQAEREKKQAIFGIIVATAKAVISALASVPPNVPLSIFAGATGAASLAVALGAKVPQFFKGTKDSPEGLAWIGERGTELIDAPGIGKFLSPDKPTLVDLPLHSKVLTHEETLNALARNGGSQIPQLQEQSNNVIGGKIDKLINTVKNKKHVSINVTRQGIEMAIESAHLKTLYLDNHYTTKR